MIYVITDHGVQCAKSINDFNRRYHVLLEEAELTPLGPDRVVKVTNQDIDFIQDKFRMSNIMFGNFFRKDNSGKVLMIVNIILTCLVIFTK